MHPRTTATLDKLANSDWFASVGVHDTTAAIVLPSWTEAIEHCSSIDWENLCLEAANQYRLRLLERSKPRYNQWNEIVANVKPVVEPIVAKKLCAVIDMHHLPKVFEDTVKWDILHVCMEAEYADVYPPGFYASQAYWYCKGHFPCGWRGAFPKGHLIIY